VYPWGIDWPDDQVMGNFADLAAADTPRVSRDRTIPGYDDGYAYTAPVGSFPVSATGLYDLSGNVQEWVEDEYSKLGQNALGVLRGGGWTTYQSDDLFTGSRNAVPPNFQDDIYGFRVVLAKSPAKSEETASPEDEK
jgi:formylglycine-generating enzyme required for sulfatase activity